MSACFSSSERTIMAGTVIFHILSIASPTMYTCVRLRTHTLIAKVNCIGKVAGFAGVHIILHLSYQLRSIGSGRKCHCVDRTAGGVSLRNIRIHVTSADIKNARRQHQCKHRGKTHQQHRKFRECGKSPSLSVTALSHNPTSQKQLPICFQNFLHIHIYARVHGIFMHYDFNTAPPPLSTP